MVAFDDRPFCEEMDKELCIRPGHGRMSGCKVSFFVKLVLENAMNAFAARPRIRSSAPEISSQEEAGNGRCPLNEVFVARRGAKLRMTAWRGGTRAEEKGQMVRPSTAGFVSRLATLVAALAAALLTMAIAAGSAPAASPYDRVLTVGFDQSYTPSQRAEVRREAGVIARAGLSAPGLQQVTVPEGTSLATAASELRTDPAVDFVQLPGFYRKSADDPYFPYLWGLNNTRPDLRLLLRRRTRQRILSAVADAAVGRGRRRHRRHRGMDAVRRRQRADRGGRHRRGLPA